MLAGGDAERTGKRMGVQVRASRNRRLWGPLTLASSLVWLLITPAASAVAASAPTVAPGSVTLTASAISVKPGQSVTFTASASDPMGTAEYQFWVELPNGQWEDAQNYSTDNTFVLSNVSAGNYLVAVDALDKAQVSAGAWSSAVTTLADGVFVNSQVLAVSLDQDVAPGTPVTLLGQATNIYDPLFQFWVEAPDGTWTQSGNYSKSSTYTFTPSQPGKYRFVAYAKSPLAANNPDGALQSAVGSSGVYGPASQVVITVASPTDVADGQEPDTVVATVEDQYGNRVANFDGSLQFTATGSVLLTANGQASSTVTAEVLAGTTTAQLLLPSGDVGVTTITADHLMNVATTGSGGFSGQGQAANVTYSSATVTGVANAAYALTLQSSLVGLSDNTVNADEVTVKVVDQAGDPYTSQTGRYVSLSLTGPGSFSPSSTMTTVDAYIPASAPSGTITVPVYSIQGESGTIVVTASSPGVFAPAPLDISTYETGMPTGLEITEANGQDNSGNVYTLYTVDVVDQAGQVITSGAGSTDAIQISDNVEALNDPPLYYYTGSVLQQLLATGTLGTETATDKNTTVANPVVMTLDAVGGQVQFAVENEAAGFPATITATDLSTGASASGTYNYYDNANLAAKPLGPFAASNLKHYVPQSVLAGQTLTMSAELTDKYGNPVPEKGQPIWFTIDAEYSFPPPYSSDSPEQLVNSRTAEADLASGLVELPNGASRVGDTYEAFTNSSGIATIQLTVPSSDGPFSVFAVSAEQEAGGGVEGFVTVPAQYQPASLAWAGGFPADGRITAGTTETISADVLNALGENLVYGNADPFNYFLLTSSNSGVLALPGSDKDYATAVGSGAWIISAAALQKYGGSTGQVNIPVVGMMSGTTTLTLQDLAPGVAPISETVTVLPGQAVSAADLWYNGAPVSTANPMDLTANVPVPISVVNVDNEGNPVPVSGSEAKTITLPTTISGVTGSYQWEPAGGGPPISSVQIPPGQRSVTVWFVANTTQVVSQFPSNTSS